MEYKKYLTIVPVLSAMVILIALFAVKNGTGKKAFTENGFGYELSSDWIIGVEEDMAVKTFYYAGNPKVYIQMRNINPYHLGNIEGHNVFNTTKYEGYELLSSQQGEYGNQQTENLYFNFIHNGIDYRGMEALIENKGKLLMLGIYMPADSEMCLECEFEVLLKTTTYN
jgi:hypothetical protein